MRDCTFLYFSGLKQLFLRDRVTRLLFMGKHKLVRTQTPATVPCVPVGTGDNNILWSSLRVDYLCVNLHGNSRAESLPVSTALP